MTRLPDGSPPTLRLTIIGDHSYWQFDTLKFLMRGESWGGSSTTSNTGPMPKNKTLADVLAVTLRPGMYRCGTAIELLKYQDHSHSLLVVDLGNFPAEPSSLERLSGFMRNALRPVRRLLGFCNGFRFVPRLCVTTALVKGPWICEKIRAWTM